MPSTTGLPDGGKLANQMSRLSRSPPQPAMREQIPKPYLAVELDCEVAAVAPLRELLVEWVVDREIPPLPPHITGQQMKKMADAMVKGDPERWGVMEKSLRMKAQEFLPGDSLVLPVGYTGTWEMQGNYRELAVTMKKGK